MHCTVLPHAALCRTTLLAAIHSLRCTTCCTVLQYTVYAALHSAVFTLHYTTICTAHCTVL